MKALLRRLTQSWFAPAPAGRLAVLRVLVGAFGLWYLLPRYEMYLFMAAAPPGLFTPVGAATILISPLPVMVFQVLLLLTFALNVAFVLGWRHAITGPAFGLLLFFVLCYRNSWSMIYHSDNLFVMGALILGFTRAADAWSLDALRRSRRGEAQVGDDWRYGWPLRLLCAVTVISYFLCGVAKIAGPLGWSWMGGEALRSQLAVDGLRKELLGTGAAPLTFKLYGQVWLFATIGVMTMVFELGAPLALLHRWAGRIWAVGVWGMHVGILMLMDIRFEYSLSGVGFAAFFPLERPVRWALYKIGGRSADITLAGATNASRAKQETASALATVVLFDGRCGMCRGSRRWAEKLDWFGRVTWLDFRDPAVRAAVPHLRDEQLEEEMWAITPDGQMRPGFAAWRTLLGKFPLTFVPALLLFVPPVPWIGRRVYGFIVRRRRLSCEQSASFDNPGGAWQNTLQRSRESHVEPAH